MEIRLHRGVIEEGSVNSWALGVTRTALEALFENEWEFLSVPVKETHVRQHPAFVCF